MLFRRNINQLLQLFNTPNNTIPVLKIRPQLIPLVRISRLDEFLSLVSEFEVDLDFFSQ